MVEVARSSSNTGDSRGDSCGRGLCRGSSCGSGRGRGDASAVVGVVVGGIDEQLLGSGLLLLGRHLFQSDVVEVGKKSGKRKLLSKSLWSSRKRRGMERIWNEEAKVSEKGRRFPSSKETRF